jgi:hypothetical protein
MPARPAQQEASGGRTHYVLVAHRDDGESELGRYTLDHTAPRDE